MKYIINKTVVFDSNELTLCLYENTQIVARLTKPATRLLLALIQNNRVSVTRETLLDNVWLNYGFTASNAGLNNYISELRKAFTSLGCHHELIITLPKLGFRFEAEIDLSDVGTVAPEQNQNYEENGVLTSPEEIQEAVLTKPPTSKNEAPSKRNRNFIFLASSALFLGLLSAIVLNNTHHKNYDYHKIISIDRCDIYVLNKTPLLVDPAEKINFALKREGVDCKNIPSDVFYLEDRISKKNVRTDLISVCSKADNNRYDTCFNIKNQRNTSI
ncbi:winged helix-turn-helix domain-containing protein [Serratia marcescens]|uniref:winged helix-turn-helix domain-containing protein n=1 Tax=Serratia marcescens TaxID=615 RepID=UPI0033365A70